MSKTIKILFFVMLCFGTSQVAESQDSPPFDSPEKPVNCEMGLLYVNDALTRYSSAAINKDSVLIIVFRLGDGENSRNLNLKRIKALKSYIDGVDRKQNIKTVFAQGEKIAGFGTIEFYLEGKLLYSLPLWKRQNLDLISCFLV